MGATQGRRFRLPKKAETLAWVVLLVGILVSSGFALNLVQNGRAERLERVDESMARVKVAFDGEMRRREDILRGVGVLWASGRFDRAELSAYAEALGVEDTLLFVRPGDAGSPQDARQTTFESDVLYQPVYSKGRFRGWVGLRFGRDSLASALRRSDPNPAARVELLDRPTEEADRTRAFEAYWRRWVIEGSALPGAGDSNYTRESVVIVVLGSLLSVLLFLLVRVLSRSEERAVRLADETVGRMLDLEERFRSLAATPVGIFWTDADGAVLFANDRAEELTGRSPDALAERHWTDIVHPADLRAVTAAWRGAKRGHGELGRQFRLARKPGAADCWVACRLAPLWGTGGTHTGWIGSLEDVTERRAHEAELARRALHDPLTELPNRTYFLDRLSQAIERARRNRSRVAVMFVDLDQFKAVNDGLGHEAGDRVLVEVAERLKGALRAGDTVARFGGDEFTVLCEDVTGSVEMAAAAGRIAAALASSVEVNGHEVTVGSSVGIAIGFGARADAEELLRTADSAMYKAKSEATPFELVEEGAPGVRPA